MLEERASQQPSSTMAEQQQSSATLLPPLDRSVQQAILAIKKGAHLLKCGRRGKPKFCPFRLSTDEKFLIWYSGQEEKQLRLTSITNIVVGQRTENFRRQPQPDRESQSFSLIYENGECTLDLICKDKAQVDSWLKGLKAVISHSHRSRPLNGLKIRKATLSCVNSPAGFFRRKQNLGLVEDVAEDSEVHTLCESPPLSSSDKYFCDGLSSSFDSFSLGPEKHILPIVEPDDPKKYSRFNYSEYELPYRNNATTNTRSQFEQSSNMKDVMIWGEGIGGRMDALLPKLLESSVMLDVQNISIGGKHAALVTKQGEVFCWGYGNGGRLGHKLNMDASHPKIVESLDRIDVKSVTCGEFQTCALTWSGEVYTWGDAFYDDQDKARSKSHWLPQKLSGLLDGVSICNVACGEWHTAIVSSLGQIFTFGDGTFGVLGHGDVENVCKPREIESLKGLKVKSVACGAWHTAAIVEIISSSDKSSTDIGKLFTWGDGDKGRLGHRDFGKKLQPTCVSQLVDYDFVQVSCARMLTVALTNTGKVYTMGSAIHGQLGNPQAKDKSITIVEGNLKHEFVMEISSGSYHIAVLTAAASVYTWGKGANGQLGLGDNDDRALPILVDALIERKVQSVACGSNLTAAICLHETLSITNQSICSGCRTTFGLTRKKHNCYNCGLRFCHGCSGRKAANASHALNKSKPSRVCDSCFNHLNNTSTNNGDANCKPETVLGGLNNLESRGLKQQNVDSVSSMSRRIPRWGQVSCPVIFETNLSRSSVPDSLFTRNLRHRIFPAISNNMTEEESISSESKKMLIEEVQRLRAEATELKIQCQLKSKKIQECEQIIEETWKMARDQAAKLKSANDVIKALETRLHVSEKICSERVSTKRFDSSNLLPIKTLYKDSSNSTQVHPLLAVTTPVPAEVKLPKDKQAVSFSSSPIIFSNSLKSLYGREMFWRKEKKVESSRKESRHNGAKVNNDHEWVEQYETGVYITLTKSPSGLKVLKRVRFSRKQFAEKEAERWWEMNQAIVYQKYGIEECIDSNINRVLT